MPDIRLRNQPFDLAFHPSRPLLYASLLTGEVKCYSYDDVTGESKREWSARPTKKTARAIAVESAGDALWMGGKSGVVCRIDAAVGTVLLEKDSAHECPVNRVICVNEQLVATGDDDGVIKFWDPRQQDSVRSYAQHYDYISDFTYFEDKRQLITTSGDGHLSAIDVRSSKPTPLALSDDQEDELLSITPLKNGTKCVVGTGLGILSVWDRKRGWGDCVDRIPGHPASVDAIVALTEDVVATGSEDGLVRVMQILPNKFLGVIATHDEYPIERLALDRNSKWLGSVSHDEMIKLTDVEDMFVESDDEGADDDESDSDDDGDKDGSDDEDVGGEGEASEVDADGDVSMDEKKPAGERGFFDDL